MHSMLCYILLYKTWTVLYTPRWKKFGDMDEINDFHLNLVSNIFEINY